jgi:hypothetical protein
MKSICGVTTGCRASETEKSCPTSLMHSSAPPDGKHETVEAEDDEEEEEAEAAAATELVASVSKTRRCVAARRSRAILPARP